MIGAPVIGAFVAFWAFWVLLLAGVLRGELGLRGILVFLALWVIGYSAFGLFFTSYVAALDIALVFTVFHGDVHLT